MCNKHCSCCKPSCFLKEQKRYCDTHSWMDVLMWWQKETSPWPITYQRGLDKNGGREGLEKSLSGGWKKWRWLAQDRGIPWKEEWSLRAKEPHGLGQWRKRTVRRSRLPRLAGCTRNHRGNSRETFTFSDRAISIIIEKRMVTRLVVLIIAQPVQTSNRHVVHLSLMWYVKSTSRKQKSCFKSLGSLPTLRKWVWWQCPKIKHILHFRRWTISFKLYHGPVTSATCSYKGQVIIIFFSTI